MFPGIASFPDGLCPARWGLWIRFGRQPWHQVGSAPTESEGWHLLLSHPGKCDKTIAAPGRDPNEEARRYARR